MGFSYVCFIPILSWLLVFNTDFLFSSFAIPLDDDVLNSPLLVIFKSFLIVLALTLLVGSLSLNSKFFSLSFLPETSAINTYHLHGEYLDSADLKTPEARKISLVHFLVNVLKESICVLERKPFPWLHCSNWPSGIPIPKPSGSFRWAPKDARREQVGRLSAKQSCCHEPLALPGERTPHQR